MTLEVNPAELRTLGHLFDDLGNELQGAVSPLTPGPGNQPSSNAVTEVAASVDHLTRVSGFRLSGYANNFGRAAASYEAADEASGHRIDGTVPPGG